MNNPVMAMEHYLQGAQDIDQAFANKQASGRVSELREMRSYFFQEYVRLVSRLAGERSDTLKCGWLRWKHFVVTFDRIG